MEKKSKNGTSAQGAEEPKLLSESDFKSMVDSDLKTVISFLLAIDRDDPTKKALTDYLYGRYMNQVHKAELEAQLKLETN